MKQQQYQYASLITSTLYSTGACLGRVLVRWMSSYSKWTTLAGSITLGSTCRYRSIRTLGAIRSWSAGHREQAIGWMSLAATLSSTLSAHFVYTMHESLSYNTLTANESIAMLEKELSERSNLSLPSMITAGDQSVFALDTVMLTSLCSYLYLSH